MAEPAAAASPYGHRGTAAIERMVEFAPSTGGLALWARHHDLPEGAPAPLAATDGTTIYYSAAFAALPLARRTGLVAHEVLHIALRHAQRCRDLGRLLGDVDVELFNTCADAIVNSALGHLSWLELPPGAVRLEALLSRALGIERAPATALLEWDVERLYRALDDREPPDRQASRRAGGRKDGPRSAQARALADAGAMDLLPADAASLPEDQAEEARTWRQRLLRGHAGDGAHSMLRALLADLPRARTPWEQVLRTQLCHSLSQAPGVSWSRPARSYIANQGRAGPHRRMPWEPGRTASRNVPRLVVIVDVSGSIEAPLLERFAREVEAITRRLEARLVLIVGDERVRRVAEFEPGRSDLRDIAFPGGGGTDFTPLLEEADRHRPDIAVVLTDLGGPARFVPRWPVLWAVPETHAAATPPFGRILVLR